MTVSNVNRFEVLCNVTNSLWIVCAVLFEINSWYFFLINKLYLRYNFIGYLPVILFNNRAMCTFSILFYWIPGFWNSWIMAWIKNCAQFSPYANSYPQGYPRSVCFNLKLVKIPAYNIILTQSGHFPLTLPALHQCRLLFDLELEVGSRSASIPLTNASTCKSEKHIVWNVKSPAGFHSKVGMQTKCYDQDKKQVE